MRNVVDQPRCLARDDGGRIEVAGGPCSGIAHRLDGALVAGPINHPNLVSRTVFREELMLVGARDSGSVSQRLTQGGLTAIVFRQGCSYRQRLEAQFTARGWLPFRRLEFGTVEGILGCVSGNVGVTVLPRSIVEGHGRWDTLRVERFVPDPLWVDTLFVRRSDAHEGTTMRSFDEMLGTAAEPGARASMPVRAAQSAADA
jgi:DNA-binding transcriptional LysR family regulator